MINLKIRQDALKKIKVNLQYTLLVAFFAEILHILLKLYFSSFITEDFIYNLQEGILPSFSTEQIRIFAILIIAIAIFNPILRLGATKFFLKTYRGEKVSAFTILDFIKRPFRAWISYIFVSILYVIWAVVPMVIYYFLIKLAPLKIVMTLMWLVYIPIFYARIRYFAYLYIIADDDTISPLKAAQKSAKMMKGNGVLLLSMLVYFLLIGTVFSLFEGMLVSMGVFGITISLFVNLAISTWALVSFAGLYCFINKESIGIVIEKINITSEEDLKKFLDNKIKMINKRDNIDIPFFSSDDKDDSKDDTDNNDDTDNKDENKDNKDDDNINKEE